MTDGNRVEVGTVHCHRLIRQHCPQQVRSELQLHPSFRQRPVGCHAVCEVLLRVLYDSIVGCTAHVGSVRIDKDSKTVPHIVVGGEDAVGIPVHADMAGALGDIFPTVRPLDIHPVSRSAPVTVGRSPCNVICSVSLEFQTEPLDVE